MINWRKAELGSLPLPYEKVVVYSPSHPADNFLEKLDIDWLEPGFMGYGPTGLAFAENKGKVTHWAYQGDFHPVRDV